VSVDLARALAGRLGVSLELVEFSAAGRVVEALRHGAWDVAFLAIDATRAADLRFTPPYVLIEGAYMVHEDSPMQGSAEVDRAGVRVATGAGSAYDLYLSRALRHARIERRSTAREAFDLMVAQGLDVAAGVRQVVTRYAHEHGALRVLEPSFMVIEQAMAVPITHQAGARLLTRFIEDMKASGFIAQALDRSGQRDAAIAPARAD
jgi:polar amino acid transport system substrate-binding protein